MSVRSFERHCFDFCRARSVHQFRKQLSVDLQFLRFTSEAENICSLTDNEDIFEQTCFRYSFYEKCAHLRQIQELLP